MLNTRKSTHIRHAFLGQQPAVCTGTNYRCTTKSPVAATQLQVAGRGNTAYLAPQAQAVAGDGNVVRLEAKEQIGYRSGPPEKPRRKYAFKRYQGCVHIRWVWRSRLRGR